MSKPDLDHDAEDHRRPPHRAPAAAAKCTMPVISSLTVSRLSSRFATPLLRQLEARRADEDRKDDQRQHVAEHVALVCRRRRRTGCAGMNMSTTAAGVDAGPGFHWSQRVCDAWPLYSCNQGASWSPPPSGRQDSSRFIMSRPRVAAMAMFAKNSVNVRPASGAEVAEIAELQPRRPRATRTPAVSRRRTACAGKTCPSGSNRFVETHLAPSSRPGT